MNSQSSLKSEAFKDVIPLNLLQAQRISREYSNYYNHYLPHQGSMEKYLGHQVSTLKFFLVGSREGNIIVPAVGTISPSNYRAIISKGGKG